MTLNPFGVRGMMMAAARVNIPAVFVSGGPIALVEAGDLIEIDVPSRRLSLLVDDAELARRRAAWKRPAAKITYGYLARYAAQVTSADTGAVLAQPEL